MKNCHFLRGHPKFSRVLRLKDLELMGLPTDELLANEHLVWDTKNSFTIVLPDEVSDSLAERFPRDFRSLPLPGVETPSSDESGPSTDQGSGSEEPKPSRPRRNRDAMSSTVLSDPVE